MRYNNTPDTLMSSELFTPSCVKIASDTYRVKESNVSRKALDLILGSNRSMGLTQSGTLRNLAKTIPEKVHPYTDLSKLTKYEADLLKQRQIRAALGLAGAGAIGMVELYPGTLL